MKNDIVSANQAKKENVRFRFDHCSFVFASKAESK